MRQPKMIAPPRTPKATAKPRLADSQTGALRPSARMSLAVTQCVETADSELTRVVEMRPGWLKTAYAQRGDALAKLNVVEFVDKIGMPAAEPPSEPPMRNYRYYFDMPKFAELRTAAETDPAIDQQIAAEKQALLVGLLAGRDKVQTFLALLNQQAVASGVQMLRYEPLKTVLPKAASEEGSSRRKNTQSKEKAVLPPDPWQELGYRKTSVALEVSGSFDSLHTFLQRMEALELLVESSEVEVKAVVDKKDKKDIDSAQHAVNRTQLTLKLSFYDLVPGADPQPDVSASSLS